VRATSLAVANFLTALCATVVFKVALFGYAASGAEGATSALLTWPRILLCLGWDVLSAAVVATVVTIVARPLMNRVPRAAIAWSMAAHAVYALFLLISYHVALIVGAPLDKAAIDLLFLYNSTPGRNGMLFASSVRPYVTPIVAVEALVAVIVAPMLFLQFARRRDLGAFIGRLSVLAMGSLVALSLVAVPGLANGLLAVHTFGLERSPLTMLAISYLRGPLRALRRRDSAPADPYCFDLRSPVAVDGADPLLRAAPRKTNLLLVILESISTQSLSSTSPTPMPFLGELGRAPRGVRFENHYTHWAQTMNAAFSIWCSELPHPEYPPITYVNPAIPCVSLPEALRTAGYDTALLSSADFAFDRQIRFLKHRRIDFMADRNDMPGHEHAWENAWGIDERVTARAVLDWIAGQRRDHPERPFFAAYNMAAGHHPYEYPGSPSGQWLDRDAEAVAQRSTLRFADDRLRDLVDGLARQQLLDSTLVAIVSDHGPGSGRAGMGRIRDASIYEGSVHVPFVVSGPQLSGVTGGADSVTLPTGHIDIAPTLLGLLGIEPPATMKGRDLTHDSDPRVVILATRPPLSQVGVRAGAWKLVHWAETGANELFDLAHDPDERVDLSRGHRGLVASLEAIGGRWQIHSRYLIENYAEVLAVSGHRCSVDPFGRLTAPAPNGSGQASTLATTP
jgi:arylsulfatase A-like enzyme